MDGLDTRYGRSDADLDDWNGASESSDFKGRYPGSKSEAFASVRTIPNSGSRERIDATARSARAWAYKLDEASARLRTLVGPGDGGAPRGRTDDGSTISSARSQPTLGMRSHNPRSTKADDGNHSTRPTLIIHNGSKRDSDLSSTTLPSPKSRDEVWPLNIPHVSRSPSFPARSPRESQGGSAPGAGKRASARSALNRTQAGALVSSDQNQGPLGRKDIRKSHSTDQSSEESSPRHFDDTWEDFAPPSHAKDDGLHEAPMDVHAANDEEFLSPRAGRAVLERDFAVHRKLADGERQDDFSSPPTAASLGTHLSPGAFFKSRSPPLTFWPTVGGKDQPPSVLRLVCKAGEACSRSVRVRNESHNTAVLVLEAEGALDPEDSALCVFPARLDVTAGDHATFELVLIAGRKPSAAPLAVMIRDIASGWRRRIVVQAERPIDTGDAVRVPPRAQMLLVASVREVDFGDEVDPVEGASARVRLKNISHKDTVFLHASVERASAPGTFHVSLRSVLDETLQPGKEAEAVVTLLPVPAETPVEHSCIVVITAESISSGTERMVSLRVRGRTTARLADY